MLYYLHHLQGFFSPLRVFEYVTVRALAGAGTAFVISLALGPGLIRWLRRLKFGQVVRGAEDLPLQQFHGKKKGTPTMGGLLIISAVTASTLLWAVPRNPFILLAVCGMCFMGAIGFLDDYLKIRRQDARGLSPRQKFALQLVWVVVLASVLQTLPATREHVRHLMVPFLKEPLIQDIGLVGILVFIFCVMVGSANAVNITDGLDGLAAGCTGSVAFAYLVMAYVAGHAVFADYLLVPFVPGSHELAVFCACLLGGALGFLWYNCHPAQVFMGDTGSLAIGGAVASVAILIKQELALLIVGGVFVAEAFSVILQVGFFKLTRWRYGEGRRIFKCAPLHHHFEMVAREHAEREGRDPGVVETRITIRLWVVGIVFALLGVATLKLR